MDGSVIDPFDQQKSCEGEQDDQDRVLDAAGRLLIDVDGHDEAYSEGRTVQIIIPFPPLLGKVPVEGQQFPLGYKAAVFYRTKVRESAAGEAGIGPGRGSLYGGFAAGWDE